VDKLIGCILLADLPSMGWARRWGDEEELAGVRQRQTLILGLERSILTKVYPDTLP
jgi:hypothetical protein